jgi:hypothetical protein
MIFVIGLWTFLRALFLEPAAVALENLALRHQLLVLQRSVTRPRLSRWDRVLWVWLSRLWTDWRLNLIIVQPATVLAWHRQGFQLYWRWKSKRSAVGRPKLNVEIRHLIHRMARENPTWGRRRIQAELALLGYHVAELTVAKNDDVGEALAADRADHPLHEGILPGGAWGREDLADPQALDAPHELLAVDTVTITEQVGRRRLIRKRFDELAAVVAKDDEDEEQAEGEGRDREEVDRDDLSGMRGEKGVPRGRRPRGRPVHVLSAKPICAGCCIVTGPTTPARVRIKRSKTTAPSPETSSRRHAAGSTPSPRSAGSITATSASPDRGRARPRPSVADRLDVRPIR